MNPLGVFFALATAGLCTSPFAGPKDLLERARALHRQVPLIDGHNDYPWQVWKKAPEERGQLDLGQPQPQLHTDLPRLRAGGVGGQFWSVYMPPQSPPHEALRSILEQLDLVHQMVRRHSESFEMAGTAADVERIFKSGKIASMIGLEGGYSIDSSLAVLRMFFRLGVRYMTLTHSLNTPWADAATDTPRHGGLSEFGETVIREMNWLGMLVDLSHVSLETMTDTLRVSEAPVIFSHSSARALCDVVRNVPDEILRRMPANGGVVMVSFVPVFTAAEGATFMKEEGAEEQRLRTQHGSDEKAIRDGLREWAKTHPDPKATLSQVADHIDHVRKVAGIDHVGIGSDFDGITSTPAGLEDVSHFPELTAELLRRGYSDEDTQKVLGLNLLRIMREAERVAARLQTSRPASETGNAPQFR